ncbi:unnamed protein product [Allacma fusca]|uniref:Uncharacterized protein n=1 Tax=Allacma fusca TaxID=39272 RepID=A0A8J2KQM1_9HEXA|nr:unnamed protein product [Allacma fusca]
MVGKNLRWRLDSLQCSISLCSCSETTVELLGALYHMLRPRLLFLFQTPFPSSCLYRGYWIDRESAIQVDQRVQKGLFIFACTNSCVNPMVYGLFHIRRKRAETQRLSNNCRLQRIEKTPYKVRVRWKPRAECLCATTSSTSQLNNSSTLQGRIGLRPVCGLNGRHIYFNGQPSPNLNNTRSMTQTTRFINNNSRYGNEGVLTTKRDAGPKKSRRVKFVNLTNCNYEEKENIMKNIHFNTSNSSNGCCNGSNSKVTPSLANGFVTPVCVIHSTSSSSSSNNTDGVRICEVVMDQGVISREIDGIATTHFFPSGNSEGISDKFLAVPKDTELNYGKARPGGNSL